MLFRQRGVRPASTTSTDQQTCSTSYAVANAVRVPLRPLCRLDGQRSNAQCLRRGAAPSRTRRVVRRRRDTRTGLATMYVVLPVWCCVLASSHHFSTVRGRHEYVITRPNTCTQARIAKSEPITMCARLACGAMRSCSMARMRSMIGSSTSRFRWRRRSAVSSCVASRKILMSLSSR